MLNASLWTGGTVAIALTLPLPALAQSIIAVPDGTGTIIQY
ncbi:MAG: hypothetical protein AAGG51_02140 [Cyanobacteria bacterium P01_G01_bin.54]